MSQFKGEGCYCEFASESAGGLHVMCQYCVGVNAHRLAYEQARIVQLETALRLACMDTWLSREPSEEDISADVESYMKLADEVLK